MENNNSTVRLVPDARVKQFVNRTASTGRRMHAVKVIVPVEGTMSTRPYLTIRTPFYDMPYKLRAWELKRIKAFVDACICNGRPVDLIQSDIRVLYDAGLPKLINCSDWERLEIMSKRSRARKGTVRISRFKYGHRTELVNGQWMAVDSYWKSPYWETPSRKIASKKEEA